jgi:hypothetical protein
MGRDNPRIPNSQLPIGMIFIGISKTIFMRDWLRTLLAGYGAYKWGGGCLGTIIVFVVLYWLLGHVGCN